MRRLTALLALALGAALACGPGLPPPDGCAPLATRCARDGVPERCSPSQRWTRAPLALPCREAAPGAVCCLAAGLDPGQAPVHRCATGPAVCLPDLTPPEATR
jgi:hypothetical protein